MGIDLEPFKALQQNKRGEGENYSPSGREKNDSVKWEMKRESGETLHSDQEGACGRGDSQQPSPVSPTPPEDQGVALEARSLGPPLALRSEREDEKPPSPSQIKLISTYSATSC